MNKKKILILLLAACCCLAGCGNQENKSELKQQLKQEGMELQAAGDYLGAIEKYQEAMELANMKVGKEEIDLAYYKASALYRSGDLKGAIDTYSAVLALKEDVGAFIKNVRDQYFKRNERTEYRRGGMNNEVSKCNTGECRDFI